MANLTASTQLFIWSILAIVIWSSTYSLWAWLNKRITYTDGDSDTKWFLPLVLCLLWSLSSIICLIGLATSIITFLAQ